MKYLLALLAIQQPLIASTDWQLLFNGQDLSGWEIIIAGNEVGADPQGYVTVQDDTIHMYRDAPEDTNVPFGVIMTEESYSSFHLSLEYRWMGKKFPPRMGKLRDAGLLYHCYGKKKVWPASVECQIQEGDTGDIVFLGASGQTWIHPNPDDTLNGQGQPGLLPENGGELVDFAGGYIGCFPELDKLEGWSTVEAIVHGSDSAFNKVNGQVISRLVGMRDRNGRPLSSGQIALQLEAAEIQYRSVRIKTLSGYLKPSAPLLSMSRVGQLKSQPARLLVTNTDKNTELEVTPKIFGTHAGSFTVKGDLTALAPGESSEFEISFKGGEEPGLFHAGLQIGDEVTGCFVQLQGLASPALEGKNEPPLDKIVRALGCKIDVGGAQLSLNGNAARIGSSVSASGFRSTGDHVSITPVARYSPKGRVPFGAYDLETGVRAEWGLLSATDEDHPDAHQSLLPPSTPLKPIPAASLPGSFGLYLAGPHFTSFTTPGMADKAKLKHTARIYPVTTFQGHHLSNAYLVGFEEASNGDYQDALFLVQGVEAVVNK